MRAAFLTVLKRSKPRLEKEFMPAKRGQLDVWVNQPRSKERGNSFLRGGNAGHSSALNGAKVGQFIAQVKYLKKSLLKGVASMIHYCIGRKISCISLTICDLSTKKAGHCGSVGAKGRWAKAISNVFAADFA